MKKRRAPVQLTYRARGVVFAAKDKAKAFAETLERQRSPVYENVDVNCIERAFRSNKASGPDGITYRALNLAPRKFVMHMTNICNAMLRLRHFPSQWKQADVVMIPKPGQSANWPQNYRPISLLPVMSKIAYRIILPRLQEETDELDVIANCQFGFRRGHSTTQQVLRIIEHIKEGFNLREYTGTIFLDVAKVFDKVRHQELFLKMHQADISKAMVRLVHSYPRKRAFKVKQETQRPTVRRATAGVPEGSTISTPPVQYLH
ncbi:hypothetical protein Trydic_g17625 [Trypoxylus dichotomus]